MSSFTVKPGDTVQVKLKRKKRERGGRGKGEQVRGITAVDPEENRYLRRSKPQVEFFDLGTRLQSLPGPLNDPKAFRPRTDIAGVVRNDVWYNRYAPIEMEFRGVYSSVLAGGGDYNMTFRLNRSNAESLDQVLLGNNVVSGSPDLTDPFGSSPANVTGRKIPNCLQLPYTFDVNDHNEDRFHLKLGTADEVHIGQGNGTEDPERKWKRRTPASSDPDERWDTQLLSANMVFATGFVKGKIESRVAVLPPTPRSYIAWPMYFYFDTGRDDRFKVTKEPSYTAAAEILRVSSSATLRVFLVPRLSTFQIIPYVTDSGGNLRTTDPPNTGFGVPKSEPFWFVGRMPNYPRFIREELADIIAGSGEAGMYVSRAPDFNARLPTYIAYAAARAAAGGFTIPSQAITKGQTIFSTNFNFADDGLGAGVPANTDPALYDKSGTLAGVIVSGSARYYVWHTTNVSFPSTGPVVVLGGGININTTGAGIAI